MPDPIKSHATPTSQVAAMPEPGVVTLLEHGQRCAYPVKPDLPWEGVPYVVLPHGWTASPAPGWKPSNPYRITEIVTVFDLESFNDYFEEHQSRGGDMKSVVFANPKQGLLLAVLDYHGGDPQYCEHRLKYKAEPSEIWNEWMAVNRKELTQAAFAEFLEDHIRDVVEPAGADLLEIINTIAVDETVEFRSAIRTKSGGVRFSYTSETKAKCGELDVPSTFLLRVQGYARHQQLLARLRYKLRDGKFVLWFDIKSPQEVLDTEFAEMVEGLKAHLDAPVWIGQLWA